MVCIIDLRALCVTDYVVMTLLSHKRRALIISFDMAYLFSKDLATNRRTSEAEAVFLFLPTNQKTKFNQADTSSA